MGPIENALGGHADGRVTALLASEWAGSHVDPGPPPNAEAVGFFAPCLGRSGAFRVTAGTCVIGGRADNAAGLGRHPIKLVLDVNLLY